MDIFIIHFVIRVMIKCCEFVGGHLRELSDEREREGEREREREHLRELSDGFVRQHPVIERRVRLVGGADIVIDRLILTCEMSQKDVEIHMKFIKIEMN